MKKNQHFRVDKKKYRVSLLIIPVAVAKVDDSWKF